MNTRNAPLYVKVGLWGIGSRPLALAFVGLSVIFAIGTTVYFASPMGLLLLLAAVWYWAAIRWMDHNEGWIDG